MKISGDNPFRPNGAGAEDGVDDRSLRQRWLTRRSVTITGLLLLLVVAFGGWLAYESLEAKSSLEEARTSAGKAREALLQGDADDTAQWVEQAASQAGSARDATHSLPWNVASAVPWLGSPFKTGQQITDVVQGLVNEVLQPSARVAEALSPDRVLEGDRVDIGLLRDTAPQLTDISAAATKLASSAAAISEPAYVAALSDARTQLQNQTSDVASLIENTSLAAQLAPSMMGADGPRTYFMGFQTNAEARGTGGLLGGFGILRFEDGRPIVDTLGPNIALDKAFTPLDLGPEYNQQYGYVNPSTDFRNSNLSAHFPYAAQIWKSMWAQQSGSDVDGVIAIDPVALSYVLGAVGPVTMPDGEQITKDNVVELTESTVYTRFPVDQAARKQYLQDVAGEVVKKVTGGVQSSRELLDALGRAVGERRIAVWSSNPTEQALLEETPLAHVIPDDPAPYAAVIVNNLGGNKLDYYLRREIEYSADSCDGDTRKSTVTVRLTNTAPDGPLTDYVGGSGGLIRDLPVDVPVGTNLTSVSLLGTQGAEIASALVNGQRVPVFTGIERGHPIFEVQVAIPRGQSGELRFLLTEPTSPGEARVPVQPLVDEVDTEVAVPECAG